MVPGSEGNTITKIVLDPDEAFPDVDPSNNVWEPSADEEESTSADEDSGSN